MMELPPGWLCWLCCCRSSVNSSWKQKFLKRSKLTEELEETAWVVEQSSSKMNGVMTSAIRTAELIEKHLLYLEGWSAYVEPDWTWQTNLRFDTLTCTTFFVVETWAIQENNTSGWIFCLRRGWKHLLLILYKWWQIMMAVLVNEFADDHLVTSALVKIVRIRNFQILSMAPQLSIIASHHPGWALLKQRNWMQHFKGRKETNPTWWGWWLVAATSDKSS